VSMASSVCLGVRHMLFVTASGIIGLGALGLQARSVAWTRLKCMAVGACLVWLAAGTVLYFPDYLAYFNEAAGGKEGGSRLLVDSNLDWGQDLPALARWLEERGNPRIQMIYFGYDSPARFGIRASMLPSRGSLAQLLEPGILAVSATYRVTAPINKGLRAALEKCEYLETLGGTIHLFRVPASK